MSNSGSKVYGPIHIFFLLRFYFLLGWKKKITRVCFLPVMKESRCMAGKGLIKKKTCFWVFTIRAIEGEKKMSQTGCRLYPKCPAGKLRRGCDTLYDRNSRWLVYKNRWICYSKTWQFKNETLEILLILQTSNLSIEPSLRTGYWPHMQMNYSLCALTERRGRTCRIERSRAQLNAGNSDERPFATGLQQEPHSCYIQPFQ